MPKDLRLLPTRGDWEYLRLLASMPADPIQVPAFSGTQLVFTGRCIAVGMALLNNSTTGGTVTLYDGQDTGGTNDGPYGFAANNTLKQTFGLNGVYHEIGVFLSTTGGSLSGTFWLIPLSLYAGMPPGQ